MSGTDAPPRPRPIPPDSCSKLAFKTLLNSPDYEAIDKLKVGDKLEIGVQNKSGVKIVVVFRGRTIFGSITHASLAKLINCIADGYEYLAKVIRIEGGACHVEVSLAKKAA